MGRHMHRTRETPNADPSRADRNATYTPATGWTRWADAPPPSLTGQLRERLDDFEARGGKLRKDSVLAVELMLSASPEWFKHASQAQQSRWLQANTAWLEEVFGERNLLQVTLHLDETTPHLHAFVVPEIEMVETRGRKPKGGSPAAAKAPKPALAASHWLDGRAKLGELQDRYAAAMEPFGLDRGMTGSKAKHRTIRSYYAAAENVMGADLGPLKIPAPPELPEPEGMKEQAMAAAGFVPRAAAVDTIAKARKQAAVAAAKQARQEANESRAAAIEATIQRRQLLERIAGQGGVPVLDKVDDLEKRLADARHDLERIKTELTEVTAGRQTDQQHIEDLREWGEGLAEHIRELEEMGVPSDGFSLKS
uniref:Plasmid recombination enzyme n=2 Tax=root TaxID=1 RepID=A0A0H5Q9C5_9ZZZZ|nr:hypothetical protein [uncultured prokaryote]